MRVCTITLEMLDNSCLEMAHAIIKYYTGANEETEKALIDLQELSEHIDAYVRAEKKAIAIIENIGRCKE